jgi:hypothetical protein
MEKMKTMGRIGDEGEKNILDGKTFLFLPDFLFLKLSEPNPAS